MYKKLGILGGMGPLATYNLYRSIIGDTPAEKDQDHIDMVILNASYIPDRTAYILGGKESPLPYLLEGCGILERAGCDVIAIPCNTSHYFYDKLAAKCGCKILNMIDLVAKQLEQQKITSVYLMATAGTIKTGVYKKYLAMKNIDIISADGSEIAVMMKVIYDIKAGLKPNLKDITGIAEKYYNLGCEKIVLGCTELSLVREDITHCRENENFSGLFMDSTEILKEEILELFNKINK